jgi:hypothetical protein
LLFKYILVFGQGAQQIHNNEPEALHRENQYQDRQGHQQREPHGRPSRRLQQQPQQEHQQRDQAQGAGRRDQEGGHRSQPQEPQQQEPEEEESEAVVQDNMDLSDDDRKKFIDFLVNQLLDGNGCDLNKHELLRQNRLDHWEGQQSEAGHNAQTLTILHTNLHQFQKNTRRLITQSKNILDKEDNQCNNGPITEFLNCQEIGFQRLSIDACHAVFEGQKHSEHGQVLKRVIHEFHRISNTCSTSISWDIDSFIALPNSLSVAKRGLHVSYLLFYYRKLLT